MRCEVGIMLAVGSVLVFGCNSAPSAPARATPVATAIGVVPAPAATVVIRPTAGADPVAESAGPSARPRSTVAPPPPPVAPIPTSVVPPRAAGVPPRANDVVPVEPAAPYVAIPTAQAPAPRQPRAFRTPERAGDQAFVAPQGGGSGGDTSTEGTAASAPNAAGPQHATSGVVILRATARTALEGFDIRVTYPHSLGHFVPLGNGNGIDCTAGTGTLVVANDRGAELSLLVASAQPLQLPLDAFCSFAIAAGARPTPGDFQVRVAEVTSNGKKADPALLLVDVQVR